MRWANPFLHSRHPHLRSSNKTSTKFLGKADKDRRSSLLYFD